MRAFTRWAGVTVGLATGWAAAAPAPGTPLPELEGRKLSGSPFKTESLDGHPTLVVIVTSREAAPVAKDWFEKARTEGLSRGVQHVALVSLKKPFFIPTSYLESKARASIPQRYWGDVVVDGGDIARVLNVPPAQAPLALAVDADGTVRAVAQGRPDGREAQALFPLLRWTVLGCFASSS